MKLTAKIVPYSSVVGSSVALHDEAGAVVAIIMVTVPRPSLDYKATAAPIIGRIASAFASSDGLARQCEFWGGNGETDSQECLLKAASALTSKDERIAELERDVSRWKNNHADVVTAKRSMEVIKNDFYQRALAAEHSLTALRERVAKLDQQIVDDRQLAQDVTDASCRTWEVLNKSLRERVKVLEGVLELVTELCIDSGCYDPEKEDGLIKARAALTQTGTEGEGK